MNILDAPTIETIRMGIDVAILAGIFLIGMLVYRVFCWITED